MARFGEGINPALGRTDYSQLLAGAMQGAQSRAQGAAAIGQGLQSLGQGIQQYQQNKAIAGTQIAKFEGAVRADPTLIQGAPEGIGKLIQKLQKDGSLKLTDAAQLGAYVDTYQQQRQQAMQQQAAMAQQQRAEADRKAIGIGLSAMQGGKMDPLAAIQSMGMQVSPDVAQYFTNMQRTQAETGKTRAEASAIGQPKPIDPLEESLKRAQLAKVQAETNAIGQPKQPQAPEGYRYKADGSLEVIPGGPAAVKEKAEAAKAAQMDDKFKRRLETEKKTSENVLDLISEATALATPLGPIGFSTGVAGQALKFVPASQAKKLSSVIQTIKANVGFDRLQRMREDSPTGGALGQVAVQELEALQNSIANLDQSQGSEQLIRNLARVGAFYQDYLNRVKADLGESGQEEQPAQPIRVRKYNPATGRLE